MAPKGGKKVTTPAAPKQREMKKKQQRPSRMVSKDIAGDKNGGSRTVRVSRMPRYYPTEERPKKLRNRKKLFSEHKHKLRASLTPGTVLIILCGRHKGKRVVFLKQLKTGLLLVTGPYHLNGCPLRRINQIYVIATKTKLDVSAVKLPERVNDEYFKRQKLNKSKHMEGEIFDTEKAEGKHRRSSRIFITYEKKEYTVSAERREDQIAVDKQVLDAVRQHADKKFMFGYLGSMFSLTNKQYPHKMIY